tara:strand:+ start:672 stop:1532 length:861 start_codon:yes stop_codon:yes gene_type:complete
MITFFSAPRPFKNIFSVIQQNAISSWINLKGEKEILLFSNESVMKDESIVYNKKFKCNNLGTPLISSLFSEAIKSGSWPVFCFINADIILPENFLDIVKKCKNQFQDFLLIGRRNDINLKSKINFSDKENLKLIWRDAKKSASLHGIWGIDYFVFTKNTWGDIPDFAIGRFMYDNWLIWEARRRHIPVIDASNELFILHQNHGYNSKGFHGEDSVRNGEEALVNKKLFGKAWNFGIHDSTHEILNETIRKKDSKDERFWYLYRLRYLYPKWSFFMKIWNKLARWFY